MIRLYWWKLQPRLLQRKQCRDNLLFSEWRKNGERIPLTIADYDREAGTITIIFQVVGRGTQELAALNQGDSILDFVGPLGKPSEFENVKKVAVIGGGVGCAIAYPQAKYLHSIGVEVDLNRRIQK